VLLAVEETPTPAPTQTDYVPIPTPDDSSPLIDSIINTSTPGAVAFVLGVAMILGAAIIMSFAIIRASKYPPPAALITSLTLLTLFAVAGGIATNNDEAWTIAAAGVGALAGSVTSIFQEGKYKPEEIEKAVAVVQEIERQAEEDDQA